jgi:HK97 family phage major capsid protein
MTNVKLLRELIAKENDPAKKAEYETQLLDAIAEQERVKLQADFDKKSADLKAAADKTIADIKAKHSAFAPGEEHSGIQVGIPSKVVGRFTGKEYALKGTMVEINRTRKQNGKDELTDRSSEILVKGFTDLLDAGIARGRGGMGAVEKKISEGTTTEGGFYVADEFYPELFAYVRDVSIALQDCTHIPMKTDSMYITVENAKASVAFTNEATDATEANPTFSQTAGSGGGQLVAKRMDGYVKVSNEFIEDSYMPGGVVAWLLEQFTESIGQLADSAVFVGTGTPMSGVFKASGYSQVFTSGSTNFSALLEADLRAIIGKVPSQYINAGNFKWYMSHTVLWTYAYNLKDGQSRPYFIPSMTQGGDGMLYGFPTRRPTYAPSVSAATTGFIVFGNLKGVVIGDRLPAMSLMADPYSFSRSNQTQFLIFTRWGFLPNLPNYWGRIATA